MDYDRWTDIRECRTDVSPRAAAARAGSPLPTEYECDPDIDHDHDPLSDWARELLEEDSDG